MTDHTNAELVAELNFLPTFVLGTIHGEPLPLDDFTRTRIADALHNASAEITRLEGSLATARRDALNEAWTIARVAAKLNPTLRGQANAVAVSIMAAIRVTADLPPNTAAGDLQITTEGTPPS
jgi:hypothetical protein